MHIYDTLSRSLQPLAPMDGERFRFYCCGPTVYAYAHIGNFRTFVIQDVFRRCLEVAGLNPYYVRNITDVDDKTIRDSQAQGTSLKAFTDHWTNIFQADCDALNMIPPDEEPGAVEHIPEQIAMIQTLVEKGHAYEKDGSVYFSISSYNDYGRLSRVKERELRLGAVSDDDETDPETMADFVLWKAWKEEDGPNKWDSPWGQGRPGWHLECSAMSYKYLGDSFDLHSGGIDLQFPHHENEIAQSVCACGGDFARLWFHTTHLLVDARKMSKSLQNFYTLEDLGKAGYHPLEVRYALIKAHYRQPLNFVARDPAGELTYPSLHEARGALGGIAKIKAKLGVTSDSERGPTEGTLFAAAWDALADDLNVPKALGVIHGATLDNATEADAAALASVLYALGLEAELPEPEAVDVPADIHAIAEQRQAARAEKNWAESDRLRDQLAAAGWNIKDGPEGFELEPK